MAKLVTSDDVADHLTRNETLLSQARTDLARVELQRSDVLLNGDDAAVDAHDAKTLEARRTVERLEARSEALQAELNDIGLREAAQALTARRGKVEAAAGAARTWRQGRYPELARELINGLAAIKAAEIEVAGINHAFMEAGRPETPLQPVEPRAVTQRAPDGSVLQIAIAPSIVADTRLAEIEGEFPAPGYADPAWADQRS